MKNAFHYALWTGKHEVLLLAPLFGLALLGMCVITTRMADSQLAPDPDQCRRITVMSAIDRTMADLQARLEAEPPLAGLKERGLPPPPPPEPEPELAHARDAAGIAAGSVTAEEEPEAVLDPDEPPPPVPLVLTGIASRKGRAVALVNRQVVEIGGQIAGFTLMEVKRYSVTLSDANGNQRTLTLGQEIPP